MNVFPSMRKQRAGVTVRATNNDAIMDVMYAIPRGPKSLPATPYMDRSGRNTSTIMIVANTTDFLTSIDALKTT